MRRRGWFLICLLSSLLIGEAATAGSLYSARSYKPLVADHRAHNPGDGLTVLIYESATASANANSDTSKKLGINGSSAVDVDIRSLTGQDHITGNLDIANDFRGKGALNRTGKLVARVSVSVDDVLHSGEMLVSGRQIIAFNNETQEISVAGRVRPQDINADNTVLSTRLSDAVIKYKGEGLLSNREKPGLITKIINFFF